MPRVPRVVYWDTLPSPYEVERLNTLADRAALDLSVWFTRRTDPDRRWDVEESDWRFNGTYIEDPSHSLESATRFARRCRALKPDLVVSVYGEAPFVVGHAALKTLRVRTGFIVQPTFDAWVRRAWWRERAKAILFRSAEAAAVPGPDGVRYARRYGFPERRIALLRQSTNVSRFAQGVSPEERCRHRARIGVHGCVFLYVGRLWKPKGLLVLIEAFRRARLDNTAISLLIVGDGVDEPDIRRAANDIDGIIFWPFVQPNDLGAYYSAANVFVFPTLGDPHGQVIEEAHAAGLPVITSDAAGDVRARVVEGITGFVVPCGDAGRLAERMLELAAAPERRVVMGMAGRARVQTWNHDAYAADFERFVDAALALPRRRTLAAEMMRAAGAALLGVAGLVMRAKTPLSRDRPRLGRDRF